MALTAIAFALAFCALLALSLLRNPLYGLYAYIAEFYLHPASRWWGDSLPDLRWSLVAASVTLLSIWMRSSATARDRLPWYSTTAARIMVLFVAWFWLVGLWALNGERQFEGAVLVTKYLFVFYMVYRLIDTPQKAVVFFIAHLTGCFYLSTVAIGSYAGGRLDGVGGPGIDDSNTLGMHLGTGVLAGAFLILWLKGWRKAPVIIAVALTLNTLIMTGSRGAFLALAAGGAVMAYLRPRRYKRVFYAYATLGILLFALLASPSFLTRVATVGVLNEEEMDTSVASRVEMLRAQVRMAALYPFGTGHRGSEILSAQYLPEIYLTSGGARSSHNALMTVLVEQGIPGAILAVWLIGWTVVTVARLKRRFDAGDDDLEAALVATIGASFTTVLVGGMFADFSKCEVQIWLFAILAAATQWQKAPAAEVLAHIAKRRRGRLASAG
jgi:O-antigen ligase